MTSNRTYNQFCGIAIALDIVGDRWTLLIIRELIPGPRRFKDLIDGLPGISTNLLTERLKSLEAHDVIHQRALAPPAGSTVYELTDLGQQLESTLLELGKWGAQFAPASSKGTTVLRLGSYALMPKTFFRPERAQGLNETFEIHAGGEVLQVHVHDGKMHIEHAQTRTPVAIFSTDVPTFHGLLRGQIQPSRAASRNLIHIQGDKGALDRFTALFVADSKVK